MASRQPSNPVIAGSNEAPSLTTINYPEQQFEKYPAGQPIVWEELPKSTTVKCPTQKSILWVELPRLNPELKRNPSVEETKTIKEMGPSLPWTDMTTGFSSSVLEREAGKTDLLQSGPTDDGISKFTVTAKTDEHHFISDSSGNKPSKDHEIKTNEWGVDLKRHVDMVRPYARTQFSLLETCPTVTTLVGMPSSITAKEVHWLPNEKPVLKKQSKTKEISLLYGAKDDEKKEMVRLAPSCPREARNPGFPSVQQYKIAFNGSNIVDISPGCPNVSEIPGLPSVCEDNRKWILGEEPLLENKIKSEVLMTVPIAAKDEMKKMGALLPNCPKHSSISGIPSILQPSIAQHGLDIKTISSSCSNISIEGDPSPIESFSKETTKDCKPLWVILPNTEDSSGLALARPEENCIPGLSSAIKPTVNDTGFSSINIIPSCPGASNVAGIPSMQKTHGRVWNTTHEPLWENKMKKDSSLLMDNNIKDMKGGVALASNCPQDSIIHGVPSVPKPNRNTNMASLSMSCAKGSQIPGFPSCFNSNKWTVSKDPIVQCRIQEKQMALIDRCERDERSMKAMVFLSPSCPQEARSLGFPSHPNPPALYYAPNITTLSTMCSQVSKIPGFQTFDGGDSLEWATEKVSLMKRLPKRWVILDTTNGNEKLMKNMVSCVTSCPKKSSIPGFPSIPNSRLVCYGLNAINLLPMCPLVSVIPGFPSVERHIEGGNVAELGSVIFRPQKNIQFGINTPPINFDKPNNTYVLVPSCPCSSKIPGFPSVPLYNMLSLLPVCPSVCSLPGLASFKGPSKCQWLLHPNTLYDKSLKKAIFVIHNSNQDEEGVKKMLKLTLSCPETSRIHGFPFGLQRKSKTETPMISLVPCCCRASRIKGFGSIATTSGTGWPDKEKTILIMHQEKREEIIMPFAGQWDNQQHEYCYNMYSMVTSCPKGTQVYGFPSAQIVNRPPNMVSLYTSASCVSRIPGFPSARMQSAAYTNIHTRVTHCNSIFEKPQNDKIFITSKLQATQKHTVTETKHMAAMAPTCPDLANPGFPSISYLNKAEKERITFPFNCSTDKYTSQELPNAPLTQSYLKDTRDPGVPSTTCISPSKVLVYGETFTVKSAVSSLYYALFPLMFFAVCFLWQRIISRVKQSKT